MPMLDEGMDYVRTVHPIEMEQPERLNKVLHEITSNKLNVLTIQK